jgi:pilus assembly protein CpaB
MKFKTVVLLTVAVGCGLVAMLGVQQVLSDDKEAVAEVGQVLLTIADIPAGTPLNDSNTVFKEWPAGTIPEGAVTELEQFEERALRMRGVAGEIVMLAKLGEKGVFGASNEIPVGMRVVTVAVNQTKTHSGLILPGDRVDVLVTFKVRKENKGMVSKTNTVLEYIKVFATDSLRSGDVAESEANEVNAKNISLLVTPRQAHFIMLAESKGLLHLSMRSREDDTPAHAESVDESDLENSNTHFAEDSDNDPEAGDVRQFLADQIEPPKTTEPVIETSTTPKWQIVIYSGDERRVEEVEIPEPLVEEASTTFPSQSESDNGQHPWSKLLSNFFSGA